MGRRSKPKVAASSAATQGKSVSKSTEELIKCTDNLLKICSKVAPTGTQLFEEFKDISGIIETIRTLENDIKLPYTDRSEHFENFLQWLRENGVNTDIVSISPFSTGDFGISVQSDLKEGDLWLTVPRKVMLCSDKFPQTVLGGILKADPISQNLAHIALALYLLEERLSTDTFWKPYFDILPNEYDTVLYYNVAEMELLKGSVTLEDSLKQFRHIARQYAYYWQLFHHHDSSIKFNLKGKFSFDSYRWAVSTVMTRQNTVPTPDGLSTCRALVPLWDMCNHCTGQLSTDYDLAADAIRCYASRDVDRGQQIFIAYGNRPNSEFFVHNAFVDDDNPNDSVVLKLGIGKNDPLGPQKNELLNRIGIERSTLLAVTWQHPPVADRLLAFIRVFAMSEGDLKNWLDKSTEEVAELFLEHCSALSEEVSTKAWKFLSVRLSLLLSAFPSTYSEDEALLTTTSRELASATTRHNDRSRMAIRMRHSEMKVLRQALAYVDSFAIGEGR